MKQDKPGDLAEENLSLVCQNGKVYGWAFFTDGVVVFFGNKNCLEEDLPKLFPKLRFRYLKQVHGDRLVEASSGALGLSYPKEDAHPEADAHFTFERNLALVIRTADCLPIFGFMKKEDTTLSEQVPLAGADPLLALAVHAGWRGVVNEITYKSIKACQRLSQDRKQDLTLNKKSSRSMDEHWQFWLGPRILKDDFEVKWDTANLLSDCAKRYALSFEALSVRSGDSWYIDLAPLVVAQIALAQPLPSAPVIHDPFASPTWSSVRNKLLHSYRRDRSATGRNLSFIAQVGPEDGAFFCRPRPKKGERSWYQNS